MPQTAHATLLPTPEPAVLYKAVGDGAVLLHTGDEVYFGLNTVGMRVWELLPPRCTTFDELCAELGRHYPDVPADTIRADVHELIAELAASGLVRPAGQQP